jgi:hypothetical protein
MSGNIFSFNTLAFYEGTINVLFKNLSTNNNKNLAKLLCKSSFKKYKMELIIKLIEDVVEKGDIIFLQEVDVYLMRELQDPSRTNKFCVCTAPIKNYDYSLVTIFPPYYTPNMFEMINLNVKSAIMIKRNMNEMAYLNVHMHHTHKQEDLIKMFNEISEVSKNSETTRIIIGGDFNCSTECLYDAATKSSMNYNCFIPELSKPTFISDMRLMDGEIGNKVIDHFVILCKNSDIITSTITPTSSVKYAKDVINLVRNIKSLEDILNSSETAEEKLEKILQSPTIIGVSDHNPIKLIKC